MTRRFRFTGRFEPVSARTPLPESGVGTQVGQSILERIAGGDERAVKECLDRYGNLVWSIVRRMTAPADAEDAVQEIFVDLWKSAGRFEPERSSEAGFIAMIARRRMIDRLRSEERRPQNSPIPEDMDFASDQHERMELGVEASLAMRALKDHLRQTGDITGGPPPMDKKFRSRFLSKLDEIINAIRQEA